jgi:hypothetical protein
LVPHFKGRKQTEGVTEKRVPKRLKALGNLDKMA